MPQEKDAALKKVLEALGLAEINSALTQQVACASGQQSERNERTVPDAASQLPDLEDTGREPAQNSLSFIKPGESQEMPALTLGAEGAVSDLSLHQGIPEIQLDNSQRTWNWPSDADPEFTVPQITEPPPTLEEIPETLGTMIADDDRTLVDESSSPGSIEGLVDELSDRVGTLQIGPGGQTQFYGPTSTFNLADMLSTANPSTRLAQNDALECLSRFGSHKPVPTALEEHLTNLYFSWQDPAFHVVDRRLYEEAKAKWYAMGDTPFYSESLRHAM